MIGKLRERVDILNKVSVIGDIGESTDTWSVSSTVYAHLKTIIPNNSVDGDIKVNEKVYIITIRGGNSDLKINSKIRYGSEFMRVDSFGEMTSTEQFVKIKAVQSDNEVVTVT